jgi:hypothetical protein
VQCHRSDTSWGWSHHPLAVRAVAGGGSAPVGIRNCLASWSTARVSVRLRPTRIPISGGVGLTLYERVRSGLDARRPGDTEVGPRSSAAVGLLIVFILVNLGSVARLVRMQPALAFTPTSGVELSDAPAGNSS